MPESLQDSIKTQKAEPVAADDTQLSPWDFDGDGEPDDFIKDSLTKGKPLEDGTPNRYTLIFDNHTIPDLPAGCCESVLTGEGDLDGDGRAELTLVQSPRSDCLYTLTTWSLKKNKWKQVFGPELFSTGCSGLGGRDLNALIVKENGKTYFYKTALNDEDLRKVKIEVKLR